MSKRNNFWWCAGGISIGWLLGEGYEMYKSQGSVSQPDYETYVLTPDGWERGYLYELQEGDLFVPYDGPMEYMAKTTVADSTIAGQITVYADPIRLVEEVNIRENNPIPQKQEAP